jgi:hypothetical protein
MNPTTRRVRHITLFAILVSAPTMLYATGPTTGEQNLTDHSNRPQERPQREIAPLTTLTDQQLDDIYAGNNEGPVLTFSLLDAAPVTGLVGSVDLIGL